MNFLDLEGNVKPLGELDHESLLRYTQRGVDALRRRADLEGFHHAWDFCENAPVDSPEWAELYSTMWTSLYDRAPQPLKNLIDECRKRGLGLDESR